MLRSGRAVVVVSGVVAAAISIAACNRDASAPGPPPNIVVLGIDTLRADHLGCYGYPRPTSPAIDRLAAQGVRFERAYSVSSWTLPAVASLFTGLLPSSHGANDRGTKLSDHAVTLAELLQQRGYNTAAFSANFSYVQPSDSYPKPPLQLGQGFESFHVGWQWAEESDREAEVIRGRYVRTVRAATLAEKVRHFVADTRQPYFAFVLFIDPHYGYEPPPQYAEPFATNGISSRLSGYMRDFPQLVEPMTAADLTFLRDRYDGEIRTADDAIDSILSTLAGRGQLDNTVVVVFSDHGEELADHGRMLHGQTLYDESVRIPLIFRGPGVPRGRVVREPVSIMDIMPTLLALAGIPAPQGLHGHDLRSEWSGTEDSAATPRTLLMELDNEQVTLNGPRPHQRAVVQGDWKLIVSPSGTFELFDLARDPGETANLAVQNPDIVKRLEARLAAHAQSAPSPKPRPTLSAQDKERLRALGYATD